MRPEGNAGPRDRAGVQNTQQGADATEGTSTLSLFDAIPTGRELADQGAQSALHAADVRTKAALETALAEIIASGRDFTAETLRSRCEPLASSPNIVGALIRNAARAGDIVAVGYRQAQRPEAHGRVLRVWRGVVRDER